MFVNFTHFTGNISSAYSNMGGDDLGKFLWFVRIAHTVYPEVVERDYYGGERKN